MATASGRTPWALDDIKEILGGTTDPRTASVPDRKGLTPVMYSALVAAVNSNRLIPLLGLLEPPQEGGDRISQLLELLNQVVENQLRMEAKMDEVVRALEMPVAA